jgi:hypothetical protein
MGIADDYAVRYIHVQARTDGVLRVSLKGSGPAPASVDMSTALQRDEVSQADRTPWAFRS